jgi:hypothetical protein
MFRDVISCCGKEQGVCPSPGGTRGSEKTWTCLVTAYITAAGGCQSITGTTSITGTIRTCANLSWAMTYLSHQGHEVSTTCGSGWVFGFSICDCRMPIGSKQQTPIRNWQIDNRQSRDPPATAGGTDFLLRLFSSTAYAPLANKG